LSIAYLATGISALLLERKHLRSSPKGMWTILIPALAVIFSIILMSQVTRQQILISLALLAVGVPVYTFFSPKKELTELEGEFLSEEAILERTYRQEKTFMAYLLYRIKLLIYRIKGVEKEWNIQEES
jgi:Ca2+/Na+ antiporter